MAYMRTSKPLEEKKMMKTATSRAAKPKGELNRGQGVTPTSSSGGMKKVKKKALTNATTTARMRKEKYVK